MFRNILFTAIFMAGNFGLFGQYFVNHDSKWNLTFYNLGIFTGNPTSSTWEFKFDDEVIFDGVIYSTLYKRQPETQPDWTGDSYYYREENGVVYKYADWTGEEDVVYNFNIDSIGQIIVLANDFRYQVIGLDSISLLDGTRRRQIELTTIADANNEETYWIDGIGSFDDTMSPDRLFIEHVDGPRITLECFYENEEVKYHVHEGNDCHVFIVGTDEEGSDSNVNIYPNPSSGNITLSVEQKVKELEVINVYSIAGKFINQFRINEINFNLEAELKEKGVYIIEIKGAEKRVLRKLVII